MFRIALKGVLARKRRLVMTSLIIVIGVAFISGTAVLSDVLERSIRSLVADAYQGIDAVVRNKDAEENPFSAIAVRKPIDQSVLERVRGVDGVRAAEGVIQAQPQLLDKKGEPVPHLGPPVFAINWVDDPALASGTTTRGRDPRGPDEAGIDFKTAEDLGFDLGDKITAQFPKGAATFTIVSIGGIGEDGDKTTGSKVLLVSTERLQELAGLPGQFNYISVAARPGVSQAELVGRLGRVLPDGADAVTGEAFIAENQESIARLVGVVTQLVSAFGYLAAFVAAFVIYNIFSILIAQRTRELALLRAVGASRAQILSGVLLEALIVGVIAAVLGLFVGFGLATVLKGALGNLLTLTSGAPRLTTGAVVTSLIVGVITTVLSALIPAFRATNVPPVAAMSDVLTDSSAISISRKVFGPLLFVGGTVLVLLGMNEVIDDALVAVGVGAALVIVSIVMLGPLFAGRVSRILGRPLPSLRGISGRLARDNAARNPKRTTATGVALTIGVTVVALIAVIAASFKFSIADTFENQIKGDLIVSSGDFAAGFDPAVVDTIAATPGVDVVTSLRFGPGRSLDTPKAKEIAARPSAEIARDPTGSGAIGAGGPPGEEVFIIGIDPATFFQLVDVGNVTPSKGALADDTIAAQDTVLGKNGWKVGDRVRLWFAEVGEVEMRVAASFDKPFFGGGSDQYIVNTTTFDRVQNPLFRVVGNLYIKVADGASIRDVQERVQAAVQPAAPAAEVQDVGTFVREQVEQLSVVLNIIYVLLALAIFVAICGIAITMSLSIYERTRELGLLRAVGMERRQVRAAVRWEAAIIALFGTTLGIVVGLALSVAFVQAFADQGIRLDLPGPTIAVIAVGGALAGLIAAWVPARRAARLDVLAAISSV